MRLSTRSTPFTARSRGVISFDGEFRRLVERDVPGEARELVFDVKLECVTRRDVDRGEQTRDQKRHDAEGERGAATEDLRET